MRQRRNRCKLTTIGTANVAAVRDGRTLLLADGRDCGSPASKSPMTAAPHCKLWWPDIRCGLNGSGPSSDRYGRLVAFAFIGDAAFRAAGHAGARPCAGVGARRRQGLRRRAFERGTARRGRPAAGCGPIQISPLCRPKILAGCRRARPVRVGGRQGLVGARKRGHYICEFRAALDAGLHRDHSAAYGSRLRRGRHRTEKARGPPHPGARMDRAARRADHQRRDARADRICWTEQLRAKRPWLQH